MHPIPGSTEPLPRRRSGLFDDAFGDEVSNIELSVVMPCLNEADTVATCVAKAIRAMREAGIDGEVIIADNGSTDGSQALAAAEGARIVPVAARGYGMALQGGIAAARGRYILMGDADDSYDFLELPKFVAKLREGHDLVQGCRLPSGGGTVAPGAMPFLHRWWGNPMFSLLARWWFHAPIHDIYCGMRAFTRAWYDRLNLAAPGMEFATEMILRSSKLGADIAEVPITLHPDGRKAHAPHLKTFRDGWRTLRFFLLNCPRWLFLRPAQILLGAGVVGYALAMPGLTIGDVHFGLNTLVFASLAFLCGLTTLLFALGTKTLAMRLYGADEDVRMTRFFRFATLERGLIAGVITALVGVALLLSVVWEWQAVDFGNLDYDSTLRRVIPGSTLIAIGLQTIFASFFVAALSAFEHKTALPARPQQQTPVSQPPPRAAAVPV